MNSPLLMLTIPKHSQIHLHSLTDGLQQTWNKEGFRGLYKGFVPALFGVSHGAIQFMIYEEMKKHLAKDGRHAEQLVIIIIYFMQSLNSTFIISMILM